MLPKPQRLTQGFPVIFRKGAKVHAPFFIARAVPAWDGLARLAVTVSAKTEKKAVRRNRIRRRLVAAARAAGFPDSLRQPLRIVLVGRSEAIDVDFASLASAVGTVFERLDGLRYPQPKPPAKV